MGLKVYYIIQNGQKYPLREALMRINHMKTLGKAEEQRL